MKPKRRLLRKYAMVPVATASLCLFSCAPQPFSQVLPPGGHPKMAVVSNVSKEPAIGYTDAMVEYGMSQGLVGALVVGVSKGDKFSKADKFTAQWRASGRDMRRIMLEEFRKVLAKEGYVLDGVADTKFELEVITPRIYGNPAQQGGQCAVEVQTAIRAQVSGKKHYRNGPLFAGGSTTTFNFETLTPEIFEKALREAAAMNARRILYGSKNTGKPPA